MGARFWLEFGLGPQGFAPIPQGFTGAVGWVPNQPTQLIPNRLGRCMPDLRKARVKTQAIRIPLLVRGWCEPCRRLEETSRGPDAQLYERDLAPAPMRHLPSLGG